MKTLLILIFTFVSTLCIAQDYTYDYEVVTQKEFSEKGECNFFIEKDYYHDESEKFYDIFFAPKLNEIMFSIQHITTAVLTDSVETYLGLYEDGENEKYFVKIQRDSNIYCIFFGNYELKYNLNKK